MGTGGTWVEGGVVRGLVDRKSTLVIQETRMLRNMLLHLLKLGCVLITLIESFQQNTEN